MIENKKASQKGLKDIPTVANVHLRISTGVKHPHILHSLLLRRPGAQTLITFIFITIIDIVIVYIVILSRRSYTFHPHCHLKTHVNPQHSHSCSSFLGDTNILNH